MGGGTRHPPRCRVPAERPALPWAPRLFKPVQKWKGYILAPSDAKGNCSARGRTGWLALEDALLAWAPATLAWPLCHPWATSHLDALIATLHLQGPAHDQRLGSPGEVVPPE